MSKDLEKWEVCDPQNAEDLLPMPYRMIDQVLRQTILYNLELAMFQIQGKKQNKNYQGKIPEYLASTTISIDEVSCFSSCPKFQNYLIAGDRRGQALVIDMAKKSLSCKLQLETGKRVNYITETSITDGQTSITTIAAILQNSHLIHIVRHRLNEPKLHLSVQLEVCSKDSLQIGQYPLECSFEDQGRLIIVKTYQGSILGFCLPQLRLDDERIKEQKSAHQAICNASSSIQRPTIYPLAYANLAKLHQNISKPVFNFKFDGLEKAPSCNDLISKLKKRGKGQQIKETDPNGKKDAKKDAKKPSNEPSAQQNSTKRQKQFEKNKLINKITETVLVNGGDQSDLYQQPKFYPFVYGIRYDVQHPRKKSFQKSKQIKLLHNIVYGWSNTKQFYCLSKKQEPLFQNIPYYRHFLFGQQLLSEQALLDKQNKYRQAFQFSPTVNYKSVYSIASSCISSPDQIYLALGLQNGTISIWNTQTMTLEHNTDKHDSSVVKMAFFQSWKLISGSVKGQVHIDNIIENKKQVKRTNTFQAKEEILISDIAVNDIGIAFVLDIAGNMRVYDLWRNEKISKISSCNNFAIAENKGKNWISMNYRLPTSSIYSNRDFSVFLSIKWPSIPTSKVVEVSQDLKSQISTLKFNPYKSKQINLHIIKNFDFLLHHFDGMLNVYKKGYQRTKLINLFSNLQYSQLRDINFNIPDFGHAMQPSPSHKSQISKSSFSQISRISKIKTNKKQEQKQKRAKLTNQVLHPEKFLFERRKIQRKQLPTNQKLIQTIRQQHAQKDRRANMLQIGLNKTGI